MVIMELYCCHEIVTYLELDGLKMLNQFGGIGFFECEDRKIRCKLWKSGGGYEFANIYF